MQLLKFGSQFYKCKNMVRYNNKHTFKFFLKTKYLTLVVGALGDFSFFIYNSQNTFNSSRRSCKSPSRRPEGGKRLSSRQVGNSIHRRLNQEQGDRYSLAEHMRTIFTLKHTTFYFKIHRRFLRSMVYLILKDWRSLAVFYSSNIKTVSNKVQASQAWLSHDWIVDYFQCQIFQKFVLPNF